jgi:receptor-type tyrosine-protein phosphatase beta
MKLIYPDVNTNTTITTHQFHYTGWPDFGVPDNSIALHELITDVKTAKQLNPGMTVLHCSAGVGRTGTFLALSRILDEFNNDAETIDVLATVLALRKDRRYMVHILYITCRVIRCNYMLLYLCVTGSKSRTVRLFVQNTGGSISYVFSIF